MDSNDIELVVQRDDDEVGPAEDLHNFVTETESKLYSQNRYFTVGMVVCLVPMLFFIGNLYQREDAIEMVSNHGNDGVISPLDSDVVAAGAQQVNLQPNQHGKANHHMGNNTNHMGGGDTENEDSKDGGMSDMMDGGMMGPSSTSSASSTGSPVQTTAAPAATTASPSTLAPTISPFEAPAAATDPSEIDASNVQAWLDATVTLRDGIKYNVVKQIQHDKESFTEGLTFCDNQLYESIGMPMSSALLVLDTETGETLERYAMESNYFGEGLTCVGDRLIQLTYKKKTGFIYDRNHLQEDPTTFSYDTTTGEGWGLTYDADRNELIVSDGSEFLHFWDADSLQFKRKTAVSRLDGSIANNINELEYWRGRVIANVWFRDFLLVIHPETGAVEKEYDFTELWSSQERTQQHADVLNGISVSADPDVLYLTGKYWDRAFLVQLLY